MEVQTILRWICIYMFVQKDWYVFSTVQSKHAIVTWIDRRPRVTSSVSVTLRRYTFVLIHPKEHLTSWFLRTSRSDGNAASEMQQHVVPSSTWGDKMHTTPWLDNQSIVIFTERECKAYPGASITISIVAFPPRSVRLPIPLLRFSVVVFARVQLKVTTWML